MSVPSGSSTLAHVYCLWASSAIYCMWLRLLSAASAAFRSLPRRILRGEAQPFHIITPFEGTSPGVLPVESALPGAVWALPGGAPGLSARPAADQGQQLARLPALLRRAGTFYRRGAGCPRAPHDPSGTSGAIR